MSDLVSVGIVTMFDVLNYTAYITIHRIIDNMRLKKNQGVRQRLLSKIELFRKKRSYESQLLTVKPLKVV